MPARIPVLAGTLTLLLALTACGDTTTVSREEDRIYPSLHAMAAATDLVAHVHVDRVLSDELVRADVVESVPPSGVRDPDPVVVTPGATGSPGATTPGATGSAGATPEPELTAPPPGVPGSAILIGPPETGPPLRAGHDYLVFLISSNHGAYALAGGVRGLWLAPDGSAPFGTGIVFQHAIVDGLPAELTIAQLES